MSERPREELLNAALDREIEQALAVDPSPEFVARVRTRVATDAAPRFDLRFVRWIVVGGASMAAAGVVAALYFGWSSPAHAPAGTAVEIAPTQQAQRSGGQNEIPVQRETPDVTRKSRTGSIAPVVAPARSPVAKARAERDEFPEVMVSASEVEGMRQLLSMWQRKVQIVERPDTGSIPDPEHMPDIVIEPITIEPIALVKMEGVAE